MGSRYIEWRIIRAAIESYARVAAAGRGAGRLHDGACFLWHGGEPTLGGVDFFHECFELQRRLFSNIRMVRNCFTTNGTLINEHWINLFHDYGADVSISLDGPRTIHDRHRPRRERGKGSFDAALQAYLMLRESGLAPGIMMVVTEEASADVDAVYDFFRGLRVSNLAFVPQVTHREHVSPESYYHFLERFFDRWLEDDEPDFYVRDFNTIITRLFGGTSTLCEYNNCCGNYLALDVDGSVYSCDLFIGDSEKRVGHIPDDDFVEILTSSSLMCHIAAAGTLPRACAECAYQDLCGGGCMYRRGLSSDGLDLYCVPRMRIVDHIISAMNAAVTSCGEVPLMPS